MDSVNAVNVNGGGGGGGGDSCGGDGGCGNSANFSKKGLMTLPTFPYISKASVSNSDVTTLPALNLNDTVSTPAFA